MRLLSVSDVRSHNYRNQATATGLASTELHLGGIRGGLGSRGVTALMATKVIARSMGVKKLTLSDFGKLSYDLLQGENLAGTCRASCFDTLSCGSHGVER